MNRLWGYLTGRGIIEPLDDIRAGNPATNPELLDYLTQRVRQERLQHAAHDAADLQVAHVPVSVETNKWNEDDQINFSHALRPAIAGRSAVRRDLSHDRRDFVVCRRAPGTRAATLPDVGVELPDGFLGNLGRPARESACECERSSNLQLGPVMALVSGPTVGNAISDPENAVAKMVSAVKDNSEVVKSLFLRFLNRPGKPDEVTAATRMFDELDAEHAKLVAASRGIRQRARAQAGPARNRATKPCRRVANRARCVPRNHDAPSAALNKLAMSESPKPRPR